MKTLLIFCFVIFQLLFNIEKASATTYNWTGTSNSNWNNNANWSGGTSYPKAGDIAQIGVNSYTGSNPVINTTGLTCTTLNFGSATSGTLTLNNAFTANSITISGNATISGSATLTTTTFILNAYTFVLNAPLNITSGSVSLLGNPYNFTNNSVMTLTSVVFTAGGNNGTFKNTGTINATASTITFSGSAPTITNDGSFNFTSSPFTFQGNGGSFTSSATATISATASQFTFSGDSPNIKNQGSWTASSSAVTISGNTSSFLNTGPFSATASTFTISGSPFTFSNSTTFTLKSGSNFTVSGNSGTVTNTSTGDFSATASPVSLVNGSTALSNAGNFTLNSSTFTASANSAKIDNTGNFTATSSPVNLTGGPFTLNNSTTGNLVLTSSAFKMTGNGSVINNDGSLSATSSPFSLTGGPATINNTGIFWAKSSAFTITQNSSIINNTKKFTAILSDITFGGDPSGITNSGSNTTFHITGSTIKLARDGYIKNSSSAVFTADSISNISLNDQSYITNSGIFNAGTSNSPGNIYTITNPGGDKTVIDNTGTFTVGSTSVISINNNTSGRKMTVSNSGSGTFTLKSDNYGSATISTISTINTTNPFTGTYNVERYINGGPVATYRGYRLLSSAVNTTSTAINDVGSTALYNLNFLSSSVFTVGPGGTATGFTSAGAGNSTIYLFREDVSTSNSTFNGGNFKGVNAINTGNTFPVAGTNSATLPVGNGYMFYYIGNIDPSTVTKKITRVGGVYADPESAVSTAIGTLNQGDVPVRIWFKASNNINLSYTNTAGIDNNKTGSNARGFNLVGNPYASSIDWDKFTNTGTDPKTGIYGPNLINAVYVYNYVSKNYGVYQQGIGGVGTNHSSNIIASGQGFFVKVDSSKTVTAATLTFHEAAKVNTQVTSSSLLFKTAPVNSIAANPQLLRVKLAQDSVNSDETILTFNTDAKNEYETDKDVEYMAGIGSLVSLTSYAVNDHDVKKLAINHMNSIDSSTRIKLYVYATSTTLVDTLSATGFESLDPKFDVYLIDHYKKDSLFFSRYQKYLFNVNRSDTASYGGNRFEIVFHKKPEFEYSLLGFTGRIVKEGILLTWKTSNEKFLTNFVLQKNDGKNDFSQLYTVISDGSGNYTYLDKNPINGINNYRLQQTDAFNNTTLSNVVSLTFNSQSTLTDSFSLYPNPVTTYFNIKINSSTIPDQVQIRVTNLMGNTVINSKLSGSNIQANTSKLLPGTYIIEVIDLLTNKSLGQKKFIKQ